jgi:hypothetical protein
MWNSEKKIRALRDKKNIYSNSRFAGKKNSERNKKKFGADLTTVLPVLFKYCCKYCYSDSRKL